LSEAAGSVHQWAGRLLVPLYHPSPQVLITSRREAAQLRDYRIVARAIKRVEREWFCGFCRRLCGKALPYRGMRFLVLARLRLSS